MSPLFKILALIFWHFAMFPCTFYLLQVNGDVMSTIMIIVHNLPNNLTLRTLRNQKLIGKIKIGLGCKLQSPVRKSIFGNSSKNLRISRYQSFLVLPIYLDIFQSFLVLPIYLDIFQSFLALSNLPRYFSKFSGPIQFTLIFFKVFWSYPIYLDIFQSFLVLSNLP